MAPSLIEATDAFVVDQNQEMTRPEAVRMILEDGLKRRGYLKAD